MAHLPRWIEDTTVDSSAMCIGYMHWVRKERKKGRDPILLPEIRHYPYIFVIEGVTVNASDVDLPWSKCTTVNCERCRLGKNGYKFRWYSKKWEKTYMQHKREGTGTWAPGGP